MEPNSGILGRNVATTSKTILHSVEIDNYTLAEKSKLLEAHGIHQNKQEAPVRRPMWFLGSDDDALQVCFDLDNQLRQAFLKI